jgi:hypothetical protein
LNKDSTCASPTTGPIADDGKCGATVCFNGPVVSGNGIGRNKDDTTTCSTTVVWEGRAECSIVSLAATAATAKEEPVLDTAAIAKPGET